MDVVDLDRRAAEVSLRRLRLGESALHLHLGETLVHGWDLAVATGRQPTFDPDVVEASLEQYRSWPPPQRPEGSPCSDATEVADDDPPIRRLAAYLGRDVGAWTPSGPRDQR